MLVRASCDTVQLLDVEGQGELVQRLVDVGDGEDAGRVVKLLAGVVSTCRKGKLRNKGGERETYKVEQEGIPAAAHGITHAIVRDRGRGIGGRDEHVQPVLLVPPGRPGGSVRLAPLDEVPVLVGRLGAPVANQAGPDGVPLDVTHPEIVDVPEDSRQVHEFAHLGGARVHPLARAAERLKHLAAVGVEQHRGHLEPLVHVWRGRGARSAAGAYLDDVVALFPERLLDLTERPCACRGRVHDAIGAEDAHTQLPVRAGVLFLDVGPPADGVHCVVVRPGLHTHDGPGEVG